MTSKGFEREGIQSQISEVNICYMQIAIQCSIPHMREGK
jgi:hypothetical protein